ncbi:uncharacterized protein LY89DRAFT_718541 [Mollisia scopiformis]|uniref:Uncharacterized protein n=1 Tax=Mollisia scopiformis TaxID=149040 RepID=A0A194X9E6_MOLSC|nr:uncharacterized protein LY89DRAFT_718541 [Mollisia scopiformis]KUJ16790.1 hypothetical protein LY89DRAFT_718541 [Mollisia scopiformis]
MATFEEGVEALMKLSKVEVENRKSEDMKEIVNYEKNIAKLHQRINHRCSKQLTSERFAHFRELREQAKKAKCRKSIAELEKKRSKKLNSLAEAEHALSKKMNQEDFETEVEKARALKESHVVRLELNAREIRFINVTLSKKVSGEMAENLWEQRYMVMSEEELQEELSFRMRDDLIFKEAIRRNALNDGTFQ